MTNKSGPSPEDILSVAEMEGRLLVAISAAMSLDASGLSSLEYVTNMTKPMMRDSELARLVHGLVPSDIDPGTWQAWSHGGETPHSVIGVKAQRKVKVFPSRDAERAMGRASTSRMRAEKLEAEAAKLMARAKAERDDEEAELHSGRALVLVLMMSELHQRISGMFAMGPAWWILEAIAKLPERKLVLRDIDALGGEADFRAELGAAIKAVCEKHRDRAATSEKARRHEDLRDYLPEGVGPEEVLATTENLKPGGGKAHAADAKSPPVGPSEILVAKPGVEALGHVESVELQTSEKTPEKPTAGPRTYIENGQTYIEEDIIF